MTLTALEEMFQGARSIMNWLGDCAKVCYNAPFTVKLRNGKEDYNMLIFWEKGVN